MRILINNNENAKKEIYGDISWDYDNNDNIYTSPNALLLTAEEHREIVEAQAGVVDLFKVVKDILYVQKDLNEWLDVPENLINTFGRDDGANNNITTFGRFDWVFDNDNYLRLLEFNAETPMGWKEAIEFTNKAHKYFNEHNNVNCNLRDMLKNAIFNRLCATNRNRGRIAIVGDLDDTEEMDTFKFLAEIIKEVNHDVLLVSVSDLRAITNHEELEDGIYCEKTNEFNDTLLYPIDVLMTFYSIEWLAKDEGGEQLIDFINNNKVALMNPTSTLQLHSKGLFAMIWFLYQNSDILDEFEFIIEHYIPYCTFDPSDFDDQGGLCVQKKLNHREGSSVEIKNLHDCHIVEDEYIIFQDYVDVSRLIFDREHVYHDGSIKKVKCNLQHTIGAYCIDNKFGGYYTRLSDKICSVDDATFVPTFVERD